MRWIKAHDTKSGDGHGTSHARQMQRRVQPIVPPPLHGDAPSTPLRSPFAPAASMRAPARPPAMAWSDAAAGRGFLDDAARSSTSRLARSLLASKSSSGTAFTRRRPPHRVSRGPSPRWLAALLVSRCRADTPPASQSDAVACTCVAMAVPPPISSPSAHSTVDER